MPIHTLDNLKLEYDVMQSHLKKTEYAKHLQPPKIPCRIQTNSWIASVLKWMYLFGLFAVLHVRLKCICLRDVINENT